MDYDMGEVKRRVRALREDLGIGVEEMAEATGRSVEEYTAQESGDQDISFTFLYKCAERLGVDMMDLMTGTSPHLSLYSLVRKGEGVHIRRRAGFEYLHKAPYFKSKLAEPMLVTVPWDPELEGRPVHLSYHEDQEIDFVLSGRMRFAFEGRVEELGPGDLVMFDATHGHGMIAVGGEPLVFLAVVVRNHPEPEE